MNYQLNDPHFNEFVFFCISTAAQQQIAKLPTDLLRHTHSEFKIKAFSVKASLEKKIEMLSRLGVQCGLFFSVPENLKTDALKESYKSYILGQRLNDVNAMIANRQFVITSRDVMAVLAVMAQNCHSETYMLNRDYAILATEIAKAKNIDKRIQDIGFVKEVMQDYKMLCKFLMYNIMHKDFVDATTGYSEKELLILLFLFINRSQFVPLAKIAQHYRTIYTSKQVSVVLHQLYQARHVERFPRKFDYSISGLGIQVLAQYIAKIINYTLNF